MTATKRFGNLNKDASRPLGGTSKGQVHSQSSISTSAGEKAPITYPPMKKVLTLIHDTESTPAHQLDESALREIVDIFNEAIACSEQQGRRISLTFDVMPDGRIWITTDNKNQDESVEDRTPIPTVARAMERAEERGKHAVARILSQPDMLSSDDMKELLGVSRQAVNEQRKTGRLLGLQGAKRQFRYPRWQIGDDGRPFAEIEKLFAILDGRWAVYRFLVQEHPELGGLSGIDALRQGQGKIAIMAAESQQQGNFS